MSDTPDSENALHVGSHHRDTLSAIFQHPVSHNIEWSKALKMLEEVGTVTQQHDGRFKVEVGGEIEVFDRPHGKDLTEQQVVDLRRMLHAAGVEPKPRGKEI